jgi:methylphosphotriester-DNA--protein-cysteine methyltransferase
MKNGKTPTKIQSAIEQLRDENETITYQSIAEICKMSKQGVHQVMKANGMSTGRDHDKSYDFLVTLDRIATANLTVKQIAAIVGYNKSIARLRNILKEYSIPCKNAPTRTSSRDYLRTIKTENHTLEELYTITDYKHSQESFRSFLRYNKIKFKKVRQQKISN